MGVGLAVKTLLFFKKSIYQDRLGTNIGKSHKKAVFSQEEEEEEAAGTRQQQWDTQWGGGS